ncbi:MAG: hypothetical protein GF421_07940 [Candidatus Aminicenantes bacterium]|nr:hypothetical protein [Candidatus Aminicenantes bacterium]
MKTRRWNLNLAESPVRNQNLFYSLLFFLGGISVVWLMISFIVFLSYKEENQGLKRAISRIEQNVSHKQNEQRTYVSEIEDLSRKKEPRVQFINDLISRKKFSWTELLTALEKSLPDNCYIVSISPMERGISESDIRLELASDGLDPFFLFINRLYTLDFSDIRLIREDQDEGGRLITEVSLSYGKND